MCFALIFIGEDSIEGERIHFLIVEISIASLLHLYSYVFEQDKDIKVYVQQSISSTG